MSGSYLRRDLKRQLSHSGRVPREGIREILKLEIKEITWSERMNNIAKFYRKIIAVIGVVLLVAGFTRTSWAEDERDFSDKPKFTRIDVPGAFEVSEAFGINAQGEIVGTYWALLKGGIVLHGFRLSNGTFTTIDVNLPGAFPGSTNGQGINSRGDIVGAYETGNGNTEAGFLLRKGTFTQIPVPGPFTVAVGINSRGDIVGTYVDSSNIGHSYVLSEGTLTNIDVPGALTGSTTANAINAEDDIVGTYTDSSGKLHGFLLSEGTVTNIDVPGALAGSTTPFGINRRGDIVGSYTDSGHIGHGFLLSKGTFKRIDVPVAFGIGTVAYGINSQGNIVGTYYDGSGTHGFLLTRFGEKEENSPPPRDLE